MTAVESAARHVRPKPPVAAQLVEIWFQPQDLYFIIFISFLKGTQTLILLYIYLKPQSIQNFTSIIYHYLSFLTFVIQGNGDY